MAQSPDISTPFTRDFPELAYLSREDLEDLLSDHTYFEAVFHSLPRVKAMYDAQAELGRANDSIAKHNLALQDGLYALRSETQTAFDQAKAFEARWKEVEKEQRDVYQRYTPQFLLMRLRHSITAQDDASEALVSAFNQQKPNADGSTKDADEFIKEFKEMRKIYHKRAMWDDRWSQGRVEWNDE